MNKTYSNQSVKAVTGTNEWAEKTVNCCTGCKGMCRYCWGRYTAVNRWKRMKYEDWQNWQVRPKDVARKYKKYEGRVMFPSTHDIFPENFQECNTVLEKLLKKGNEVLVVSKPYLECIESICNSYIEYRDNMMFRFTIGASNDDILSFWEPGATSYNERKASLRHAYEAGFKTSVSTEPMLDTEHVDHLVKDLAPYITHSLWLGKMNYIYGIKIDGLEVVAEIERIKAGQTDEKIKEIYNRHKDTPIIRWKDSIKKVVGIEQAEKPGMDM